MSDKRQAAELEDVGDINSAVDDAWAEAVRKIRDKREKGGPGSGHFGHEGRPGLVGGSKPSGGGKKRIITSPSGTKVALTPSVHPKQFPDELIPGRAMTWNQARKHAKRALKRTRKGDLFDPTEAQLDTTTLWLTSHDERIAKHINYIYWPETRKDFLNEALRDRIQNPQIAGAYWDEDYDKIVMGTKQKDFFDHEVGHALFRNTNINTRAKWIQSWKKDESFDRNTDYAHTNYEEGFCETYMAFIHTGGQLYKGYPDLERTYSLIQEAINNVKIRY